MKSSKLVIVGTGSCSVVVAALVSHNLEASSNPPRICLFVRRPELLPVLEANRTRLDIPGLSGIRLPPGIQFTSSMAEALKGATHITFGTPSRFAGEMLTAMQPHYPDGAKFLSLVKGFVWSDATSTGLRTITQHASSLLNLSGEQLCAMSGPNLYTEIACNLEGDTPQLGPTISMFSSPCTSTAVEWASLFDVKNILFTEFSNELVASEVAGAMKNVIAMAAGYVENPPASTGRTVVRGLGKGYCSSVTAAGISQTGLLAEMLDGSRQACTHPTMLADLYATLQGGRSYRAGRMIAEHHLSPEEVRRRMAPLELESFRTLELTVAFIKKKRAQGTALAPQFVELLDDLIHCRGDRNTLLSALIGEHRRGNRPDDPPAGLDQLRLQPL